MNEMQALRKERIGSITKIVWSFLAGAITTVIAIGLIVNRMPDSQPMPQKSEIKMIETKTFAGKPDVNAIVFCINGKKMVAIYTKSDLQEVGKCDEKDCSQPTSNPEEKPDRLKGAKR